MIFISTSGWREALLGYITLIMQEQSPKTQPGLKPGLFFIHIPVQKLLRPSSPTYNLQLQSNFKIYISKLLQQNYYEQQL